MGKPIAFNGQNFVYQKPADMTDRECGPLPTLKQDGHNISCWKLDQKELEEIKRTGVIWLDVLGEGMPPVIVSGKRLFVIEGEELPPVEPGIRFSDGMDMVGKEGKLFINKSICPISVICKSFIPHQLSRSDEFTSSVRWEFLPHTDYLCKRMRRFKSFSSIRIVHGDIELEIRPEWLNASSDVIKSHGAFVMQTSYSINGTLQTKFEA